MPVETKISFSDGSSDTPRKLSDDSRKHLSDHSVVLTEDTDSFIIGERVWVGGTKPGQIAYIGETQFAPGDWAGIVLDEPIGKNDGSVAGIRYFQCSEKRGVFSRLTRLTRVPLVSPLAHDASPASDAGSVFERPPSGMARRRALSPNGSVRSVVSSKMNASISTTKDGDFRLGDRVIVSSSRGSKAGILRYVGVTDFAPGVWAGVELDDPLGKNDGSVEGKRYFECAPRFGLFAPISKVSRSPSNRKPGNCAIHSNGRMTPMRRSNSRESLTSLGTSIASSRVGTRLGGTIGSQVGWPRARSAPPRASHAAPRVRPHASAPSLLDKTLLIKHIEYDRCAVIALPTPRVCYDITFRPSRSTSKELREYNSRRWTSETLPKSWRCSESVLETRSRRSLSSGSSGSSSLEASSNCALVRLAGRAAGVARTSRGAATDMYLAMPPPRTHFSGFGRSYHHSCVSPFQFTYPYVVYI